METEVEEAAGSGFVGLLIKLIVFVILCAVIYVVVGSMGEGGAKLLTGS